MLELGMLNAGTLKPGMLKAGMLKLGMLTLSPATDPACAAGPPGGHSPGHETERVATEPDTSHDMMSDGAGSLGQVAGVLSNSGGAVGAVGMNGLCTVPAE